MGRYFAYPYRNKSTHIIYIKDSIFHLSNNDNSSGDYIFTKKADTLFLQILAADSNYWSLRHPIKYALTNKGYIFIDNNFPDIKIDAYYDLKHPILARKKNLFFSLRMAMLYRNELKRLLLIKNKSSLIKCRKIVKLFKQDCTVKLYHKLSKRDLGI